MKDRSVFKLMLLLLGIVVFFLTDIAFGTTFISWKEMVDVVSGTSSDPITAQILLHLRLPKALTAFLVGGALGVSGLMMQTLFRNPLAGPDVLGINSGAGLGVALLMLLSGFAFPLLSQAGEWSVILAAIIGAFVVLLLIFSFSWKISSSLSLLIVGLMLGYVAGALISLLQSISNPDAIKMFIVWTFGSLSSVSWIQLQVMIPVIIVGLLASFLLQKKMDVFLLGDDYAKALGVSIQKTRFWMVLTTAVLAGTATAFCGPIAFIGVTVPHIARALFQKGTHATLLPAVFLSGALLMLICDVIASSPFSMQLPINTVTSLFGGPMVVWIMLRRR